MRKLLLTSAIVFITSCGDESRQAAPAPVVSSGGETPGARANQQGHATTGVLAPQGNTGPSFADVLGRSGYGSGSGGGGLGLVIGGDREHPVPTCGALESYLYVARDFQCPGGGNPLGGDPRRGSEARVGNVGSHAHGPERDPMLDAHIVDQYDVPCPTGPISIYVCLYHCPEGRSPVD